MNSVTTKFLLQRLERVEKQKEKEKIFLGKFEKELRVILTKFDTIFSKDERIKLFVELFEFLFTNINVIEKNSIRLKPIIDASLNRIDNFIGSVPPDHYYKQQAGNLAEKLIKLR